MTTNGRTSAVQDRTDAENLVIEALVRSDEEGAFVARVVEDVARIRCAVTNDLPLIAEQLASRLLVVAERRNRQIGGQPVDVRKFGVPR